MRKFVLLLAIPVAALAGCAGAPQKKETVAVATTESAPAKSPAVKKVRIPRKSRFARVTIGMTMKQVYDLIGRPTDQRVFPTGKNFIPFYYGDDGVRMAAFYRGEGRIIFSGVSGFGERVYKVVDIEYDPSENGYGGK